MLVSIRLRLGRVSIDQSKNLAGTVNVSVMRSDSCMSPFG
jgi:hypothetical protein